MTEPVEPVLVHDVAPPRPATTGPSGQARPSASPRRLRTVTPTRKAPCAAAPHRSWRPFSTWQRQVPSWLASLVVHALGIIVLGWLSTDRRPWGTPGAAAELSAALGESSPSQEMFTDEATSQVFFSARSDTTGGRAVSAVDIFGTTPPVDSASVLPRGVGEMGLADGDAGQALGAGGLTEGFAPARGVQGELATTHVYGIEGRGSKFVYVFDRSASMGESNGMLLRSAKAELLASLADLGKVHQFQIIFYNQEPTLMSLARQRGGLVFGNDQTKRQAEQFVSSIVADGATEHFAALERALALNADVIYFLTDADEPGMSAAQLASIERRNAGRTTIHTIQFGAGPAPARENFLGRIARASGGRYVYIDVTQTGALDHASR